MKYLEIVQFSSQQISRFETRDCIPYRVGAIEITLCVYLLAMKMKACYAIANGHVYAQDPLRRKQRHSKELSPNHVSCNSGEHIQLPCQKWLRGNRQITRERGKIG